MIEVEVKAKLDDVSEVRKTLKQKGAAFVSKEPHSDATYGFEHDFPPKDGGVIARIRTKKGKTILELKEIDRNKGGIEIPYEIKEVEPYHRFLQKLGFKRFFTTETERETYTLDGFTICLDNVKELGTFIEVEKLISAEKGKEKTMQECKTFLTKIVPKATITKEKYGDMMCRKLKIKPF